MDSEMNPDELRSMVLSFAGQMGRRCREVVREAGLTSAHLEDELEVVGVTWDVNAVYYSASDLVRVSGTPRRDVEHPPHPFMLLFSMGGDDDGSFSFMVPAAWLPAAPMADAVTQEMQTVSPREGV